MVHLTALVRSKISHVLITKVLFPKEDNSILYLYYIYIIYQPAGAWWVVQRGVWKCIRMSNIPINKTESLEVIELIVGKLILITTPVDLDYP